MLHSSGRHHNDHSNVDFKSTRAHVGMPVLSPATEACVTQLMRNCIKSSFLHECCLCMAVSFLSLFSAAMEYLFGFYFQYVYFPPHSAELTTAP